MIDTHSHLYVSEFENDVETVIERAIGNNVDKIFLPAIDSASHEKLFFLQEKFPKICYPMIGLHPCSVNDNYFSELEIVRTLLSKHQCYAIGETGLDFYWDKIFVKEQYIALNMQIEIALEKNLPIVLHTRNAMQETIDVIKKYKSTNLRGIFHCFTGSLHEANQIIELGFLLGIGGVVTYKNSGLDKVLPFVDNKYIVLETDAPYLSPVPYRGKRNEPAYLKQIAQKLAEIKSTSFEEIVKLTSENAMNLFFKQDS